MQMSIIIIIKILVSDLMDIMCYRLQASANYLMVHRKQSNVLHNVGHNIFTTYSQVTSLHNIFTN